VVEGDRFLAAGGEPLVDHVEHLEERHVGGDPLGRIRDEPAGVLRVLLPPDDEGEVHG
jgi:hypothetical protein